MRTAVSGRWSWWTGLELSWRGLPDRRRFALADAAVFRQGWAPAVRAGEDYAMAATLAGGKLLGDAPFDELFMLGLERDNDLWMRGHIGTAGGHKGSAPPGRCSIAA